MVIFRLQKCLYKALEGFIQLLHFWQWLNWLHLPNYWKNKTARTKTPTHKPIKLCKLCMTDSDFLCSPSSVSLLVSCWTLKNACIFSELPLVRDLSSDAVHRPADHRQRSDNANRQGNTEQGIKFPHNLSRWIPSSQCCTTTERDSSAETFKSSNTPAAKCCIYILPKWRMKISMHLITKYEIK